MGDGQINRVYPDRVFLRRNRAQRCFHAREGSRHDRLFLLLIEQAAAPFGQNRTQKVDKNKGCMVHGAWRMVANIGCEVPF